MFQYFRDIYFADFSAEICALLDTANKEYLAAGHILNTYELILGADVSAAASAFLRTARYEIDSFRNAVGYHAHVEQPNVIVEERFSFVGHTEKYDLERASIEAGEGVANLNNEFCALRSLLYSKLKS